MQYTNHAVKVQKLQTAKRPVHTHIEIMEKKGLSRVCVVLRSTGK